MIELRGWIFDFEHMEAVDEHNREYLLMTLNDEMYVKFKHEKDAPPRINSISGKEKVHSWMWPALITKRNREEYSMWNGSSRPFARQLHRLYLEWCIETTLLAPGDGR